MKHSQVGDTMVRDPITIEANVNILDAQEIMRSWGMRHLPVVADGKIVGVISDRDIYRTLALKKNSDVMVADAMSDKPYVVSASTPLRDVAQAMAASKFGCVVIENSQGGVRGIFTTTDALFILSQLLEGPNDKFRVMNIDEYLHSHQKLAI